MHSLFLNTVRSTVLLVWMFMQIHYLYCNGLRNSQLTEISLDLNHLQLCILRLERRFRKVCNFSKKISLHVVLF